jgi:hypothetical protein
VPLPEAKVIEVKEVNIHAALLKIKNYQLPFLGLTINR